jgi:hypothetical protein
MREPFKHPPQIRRSLAWAIAAPWAVVVAAGMGLLAAYANTAGPLAHAPTSFAQNGAGPADSPTNQLLMFVHPRCPCSLASMDELARIMTRCPGQLDATVYFLRPQSRPVDWERTRLWDMAASIPGVHAETDIAGAVADRFHANTSGEVLLYDRAGQLRFQGGITSARGHAGDNRGASAVIAIARGEQSDGKRCPVFGCPLHAEAADGEN